jgi:hypothetical protein
MKMMLEGLVKAREMEYSPLNVVLVASSIALSHPLSLIFSHRIINAGDPFPP